MINSKLIVCCSFLFFMVFNNYSFNENQIESKPNINKKTEKIQFSPKEDRWAIIIGISKYQESKHDLKFSSKDANDFKKLLIEKCRFKNNQINLLCNEKATYEKIRRALEGWTKKNIGKDDNLVIFFSGHGMRDLDDNNDEDDGLDEFFIPYDFQEDDISSAIRDDVFAYWINSIKAKKIIIFLDSCFSGGAAKGKGITNTKINIKDLSLLDDLKKDIYGEVPNKKTILIGASKSNQVSSEDFDFKNGVFTKFILDSINKNSDLDFDNIITTKEIFNFISGKIPQYTISNKMPLQEPTYINPTSGDFDFAYLPLLNLTGINEDYDKLMKLAEIEKSVNKKVELLKKAVSIKPDEFDIFSQIAREYFYEPNLKKSIYYYDAAISTIDRLVNSRKWESYDIDYFNTMKRIYLEGLSKCYTKTGDLKTALDILNKAKNLKKNEDDYKIYISLGNLYELTNDLEKAKISYITSINLFNIQSEAYVYLARLFIKSKQYNEAIKTIKRGLENHADELELNYLNYIMEKYLYKKLDSAKEIYSKILKNIEFKRYIDDIEVSKSFHDEKYVSDFLESALSKNIYFSEAYFEYLNYSFSKKIYQENRNIIKNKLLLIYPFMVVK